MSQEWLQEEQVAIGEGRAAQPTAPRGWTSQVLRYWLVIALIVILCVAGAVIATLSVPTTYTGRASLIVSSPNRAPDQDAVLVQGYVDYFNDGAYQAQLAQEAGLTDSVSLSARAAASSPILLVESTSTDAEEAQTTATAVAKAFQADINAGMEAQQEKQINRLQQRIDEADAAGGQDTGETATTVASLRQQITDLQKDTTNRLQELQFQGGVAVNSPNLKTNVVFAVFGGLLLGVLAALGLARLASARAARRRARAVAPRGLRP